MVDLNNWGTGIIVYIVECCIHVSANLRESGACMRMDSHGLFDFGLQVNNINLLKNVVMIKISIFLFK